MKVSATSWPQSESVFELSKRVTLTAENESDAKVLGLLTTALRNNCDGFETVLSEYIAIRKGGDEG